jgi:hypothetical protein
MLLGVLSRTSWLVDDGREVNDVWCKVDRISEFDSVVINYLVRVLYSVLDIYFIIITITTTSTSIHSQDASPRT